MLDPILKSLGFDTYVFVYQIVLFIALWIVMSALFWNPVLAHLRQRDQRIAEAHRTVDETRHEMEQLRADYMARLAQIESEARAHIQTAIKEAQTERERLLAEAREQAEAAIRKGIEDMERDRIEALESLRERMIGLAVTATGKALGPVADPALLRRTIEEKIARVS